MKSVFDLEFGSVVYVNFDPSIGHEYKSKRPAIVLQSRAQLRKSNLVTLVPLTSNLRNKTTDDITLSADKQNKLMLDSIAKVYCITSFDYSRIEKCIGKVDNKTKVKLKAYLRKHFDLQESTEV